MRQKSRRPGAWIIGSLLVWSTPWLSLGQDDIRPDVIVTLNEGIYYYLEGELDRDSLELAIERFTAVLEVEPANTTALLFRALTTGRNALLIRQERESHRNTARIHEQILEIRTDPERLADYEADAARAREILADEAAEEAETRIADSVLRFHERLLQAIDRERDKADEALDALRIEAVRRSHAAARRGRDKYLEMLNDLRRLIDLLDRPEAVIRLLEVVAHAKVARVDAEEARELVRGYLSKEEASGPVGALRSAAAERLADAAGILESLLQESTDPDSHVRTRFFLGVIRFRQAIPLRAEREPPGINKQGLAMLDEAERIMAELADDTAADDTWRSYAALYLGIITPFRAATEADEAARNKILDVADRRLDEAAALDAAIKPPGSTIPDLVWRQRKVIADLREALPVAPPRQDLTLSLYFGLRRDTNVVLLGERTDLPRDISRERDYGAVAGFALDYTHDISQRLTLGLQVRTSQLWNVDVHEFNQQTYGTSFALQHELMKEEEDRGPFYLSLQYDFDYTLLGHEGFLESHAITPMFRMYNAQRKEQTDVFFTYERRDYFEPLFDRRFNRDGTYLTVGAAHRVKLKEMTAFYEARGWEPWGHRGDDELAQTDADYPQRFLTPYFGVSYSWDATAGDEFDRRASAVQLGVELPLPWGVALDATSLFEWERYPQGSLVDFHRRQRRDVVQQYGLALSRTFVLQAGNRLNRYAPAMDRLVMTVRGHVTWTLDDSNVVDRLGQAIFEYDRTVFGISVGFTFN